MNSNVQAYFPLLPVPCPMMGTLRAATDIFVGDWKLNPSKSRLIDEMRVEGLDERTLEITDKIKGKITRTEQIELSPDRKTLTRTVHPVGQPEPNIFVFERQELLCFRQRRG